MASVDPGVCRLKYDAEVERLRKQRSALEERRIFLLESSTFPFVDILFVPRKPLQIVAPPQVGRIIIPQSAMVVKAMEFPSLSARTIRTRFDLTDYDLRAPSLTFYDGWTDTKLTYATMFRAMEFEEQRQAHLVLLDDHPNTHLPFLCLRGIREYHEHPQHSGDDWLLYRTEMNLFSIVMSAWRACVDLPAPVLVLNAGATQLQWSTEEKK